ncbi:hypothetical protein [Moorena bouillonii]|uniref:hypothetical protein n=1 Tax=Moorena bouillonii TaxID=207920 RepID=UPI0011814DF8|nr:hypothetical protein [Moorena bouillonii]
MSKNVLKDTNLILIENNFFPLHTPPPPYTPRTPNLRRTPQTARTPQTPHTLPTLFPLFPIPCSTLLK